MSNHVQALLYSVSAMRRVLHPPPKAMRMLPSVFVDSDGQDWPECEEANERARRYATALHIEMKVYDGIGPNEDGCEL